MVAQSVSRAPGAVQIDRRRALSQYASDNGYERIVTGRTVRHRNWAAKLVLGALALTLGGCGGLPTSPSDWVPDWKFNPHFPSFSSDSADTGFTVFQGAPEAPVQRAATPADLVNAQGQCASAPAAGAAGGHVTLTMTECEVVAANGPPTQVTIGADAAGERQTVMTYDKGDHPGTYTFVAGRLKVMEELPGPAKPEPRKRVAKKSTAKKTVVRKPAAKRLPPKTVSPAPPATAPAQSQ